MKLTPLCPGGCQSTVPPGHHFCLRCWATIAEPARRIVIATYRTWCRGGCLDEDEQPYVEALAWAARSALYGRGRLQVRRPDLKLRAAVELRKTRNPV